MGRHNLVLLYAQVIKEPKIITNIEGNPMRAILSTNVVRGKRDFGNNIDHLKYDNPTIMTGNPDIINTIAKFKKNDMIIVKGAVTTRDVNKSTTCPECGTKNTIKGNVVYISPIFIGKAGNTDSDEMALKVLKEHCEISNVCVLVGTVCKKPAEYEEGKIPVVQYSLAVNRKYNLKDGREEERVDYPIIKSYGNKALSDNKVLKVGSTVLIDGVIQTRTIERISKCNGDKCEKEYKWNDSVVEIVPYATEYLRNCRTSEEIECEQLDKLDTLSKKVLRG